jgi:hypothetical protein
MTGELVEDLRLLEPVNPLLYAGWALGLLLLVVGVVMFWRRRRKRGLGVSAAALPADPKAARKHALAALDQLSKLVEQGDGRTYAIESSAVIREYIERRFGLRAPVLATKEFLEHARGSLHLDPHHAELLAEYLRCCDLLKFGRSHADLGELQQIHGAAIRFVMETRYSSGEAAA